MKKIFLGLTAIFLNTAANALPIKLWESGGQIRDVHLQDYSPVSPNTNPERDIAYLNASADSAGFINNRINVVDPTRDIGPASESFWGTSELLLEPGTKFRLGQLRFWNWDALEGNNALDVRAQFYSQGSVFQSGAGHQGTLSLLANFDVSDSGNDRSVTFTPTTLFENFSVAGIDYNLTFDSICKAGVSGEDCGSSGFSLDKIESKFNVYARLGSGAITEVPEPSSLSILLAGLAGLFLARQRRRHQ